MVEEFKLLNGGKAKKWQPVFTASIRLRCGGLLVLECKTCNLLLTPLTLSSLLSAASAVQQQQQRQQRMSAQQEVQQRRQRAKCRSTQLQILSAARPDYVRTF